MGEVPINLMKVMNSNEELTRTDLEAKPGDLSNMSQDKYYLHKYVNTRLLLLLIICKRIYFLTVLWKILILGIIKFKHLWVKGH